MSNECRRPRSSSQFHRIVPICTLTVLDPPKPLTTLLLGRSSPTKSPLTWDMHPVHRLLTPIISESVSKQTFRSVAVRAFACSAKTLIVRATVLLRDLCRFTAFAIRLLVLLHANFSPIASHVLLATEQMCFHALDMTFNHHGGLPLLALRSP